MTTKRMNLKDLHYMTDQYNSSYNSMLIQYKKDTSSHQLWHKRLNKGRQQYHKHKRRIRSLYTNHQTGPKLLTNNNLRSTPTYSSTRTKRLMAMPPDSKFVQKLPHNLRKVSIKLYLTSFSNKPTILNCSKNDLQNKSQNKTQTFR